VFSEGARKLSYLIFVKIRSTGRLFFVNFRKTSMFRALVTKTGTANAVFYQQWHRLSNAFFFEQNTSNI
jgi:hypothetical protein